MLTAIECKTCHGSGQLEYETVNVLRIFDPFQHDTGACNVCGGSGQIEVMVCERGHRFDDCPCDEIVVNKDYNPEFRVVRHA